MFPSAYFAPAYYPPAYFERAEAGALLALPVAFAVDTDAVWDAVGSLGIDTVLGLGIDAAYDSGAQEGAVDLAASLSFGTDATFGLYADTALDIGLGFFLDADFRPTVPADLADEIRLAFAMDAVVGKRPTRRLRLRNEPDGLVYALHERTPKGVR